MFHWGFEHFTGMIDGEAKNLGGGLEVVNYSYLNGVRGSSFSALSYGGAAHGTPWPVISYGWPTVMPTLEFLAAAGAFAPRQHCDVL